MELDPTHSSRRINKLAEALRAERYLEVGVCKGPTFVNVGIKHKDAVDPKFLFDHESVRTRHVRTFEITSDDFFINKADVLYDVIFLDGLHTFEQTFRDFCASISYAHRKTVWIIDDTMPNDVFSAHRDQNIAIQTRAAHGKNNFSWHGDVYKMVPTIHDFFPQFSYLTISANGNPQTLVWFEPRTDFAPKFDRLEPIDRLDYYDFVDLKGELFNIYDDEDLGIKRAVEGVTSRR